MSKLSFEGCREAAGSPARRVALDPARACGGGGGGGGGGAGAAGRGPPGRGPPPRCPPSDDGGAGGRGSTSPFVDAFAEGGGAGIACFADGFGGGAFAFCETGGGGAAFGDE